MDATPGAMLAAASGENVTEQSGFEPILDEIVDPAPTGVGPSPSKVSKYIKVLSETPRKETPCTHISSFTKARVAQSLINALWQSGHFKLEDLSLSAAWKWNDGFVGRMAAFYESVRSACEYMDSLGIRLNDWTQTEGRQCQMTFKALLANHPEMSETEDFPEEDAGDVTFKDHIFGTENPIMRRRRKCPEKATGSKNDWIIYIPFDTCDFRLGGSLLSEATDIPCGSSPDIGDADYFMDCFEVVRELVEDGVVTAGVTVGDGGIANALSTMMKDRGIRAELSGIMRAYAENDILRILFSEVPGAIIEISDEDYDYVDAELLLQDVAFYPLGHPSDTIKGVKVSVSDMSDITGILQSLLSGGALEGED